MSSDAIERVVAFICSIYATIYADFFVVLPRLLYFSVGLWIIAHVAPCERKVPIKNSFDFAIVEQERTCAEARVNTRNTLFDFAQNLPLLSQSLIR